MTPTQISAFQAGAGVTPNALLIAIASIVMVLAIVWVVWITFGVFRAWQEGQATLFDLMWNVLRASIVLMVLGFYVR